MSQYKHQITVFSQWKWRVKCQMSRKIPSVQGRYRIGVEARGELMGILYFVVVRSPGPDPASPCCRATWVRVARCCHHGNDHCGLRKKYQAENQSGNRNASCQPTFEYDGVPYGVGLTAEPEESCERKSAMYPSLGEQYLEPALSAFLSIYIAVVGRCLDYHVNIRLKIPGDDGLESATADNESALEPAEDGSTLPLS